MTKQILSIAFLLAVGACSNQTESAAVESAPSVAEAPGTNDNGPPPPVDPAIAGAGDAELEAAIRATDPNYNVKAIGADDGAQKARYAAARVDLNGDGNPEAFVYLMGPYFCGSGGCNLLVFSQGMDGYTLLANIPTSDPPVIIAESSTNGYKDFWRMQTGGGMPAEFVQHTFENGKYTEKSRKPAAEKPSGIEVLSAGVDFSNGTLLEPKKD
jgi:hypothetical protein